MKSILITAFAALSLAACASGPSAYGPAYGSSGLGFENTKIQSDRFRVAYTGRSPNEAHDYALLRAAEITLAEGYSHFEVIRGDTYGNGGRAPVSSSIGIGTSGYRGGRPRVGVGVGVGDVARAFEGSKVTHSIEIKLSNTAGTGPDSYDAKSVSQSIRPKAFTP